MGPNTVFVCAVCGGEESRVAVVEEVFKVGGRYVLVGGVPCVVCERCGERSFSRETTERVRRLARGRAAAPKSVPMQVYEFA